MCQEDQGLHLTRGALPGQGDPDGKEWEERETGAGQRCDILLKSFPTGLTQTSLDPP